MPTAAHLPEQFAANPVLASVLPVIAESADVHTDPERVAAVARWMAYEELPLPQFLGGFPVSGGRERIIDFTMTAASIDFAFTDFDTSEKFEVDYAGARWSDSDALFACLHRALEAGTPVLDGRFLAQITEEQLGGILRGSITIPMLAERAGILRQVGEVLVAEFGGSFTGLVDAAGSCLHSADGAGIVDLLTSRIPRFDDVSPYGGRAVRFDKLAQLAVWMVHTSLGGRAGFPLADLDQMTAFADYIVPVGLEVLGITRYSAGLADAIAAGRMVDRDSSQEVEIRAHCVYAVALLTDAINRIRPADRQVVMAQVDSRLWTHYHTTFRPHHLTRTVMY